MGLRGWKIIFRAGLILALACCVWPVLPVQAAGTFTATNANNSSPVSLPRAIASTPLLSFSAPAVTLAFGVTSAGYSLTVSNTGTATAENIRLYVDFGSVDVTNAVYTTGANPYFTLPDITAGGNFTLTFTLGYNAWCTTGELDRSLIWQPVYEDSLGNSYSAGAQTSALTVTNKPGLQISLTGGADVFHTWDTATYHLTSYYSGATTCGIGTIGQVSVVVTVSDGFDVVDAGGGVWTAGSNSTGGTIAYSYTQPATLTADFILRATTIAPCGATITTSAAATCTDCGSAVPQVTTSRSSASVCLNTVSATKLVNPVACPRCDDLVYTNTYTFPAGFSGTLNSLIFTDLAEHRQSYKTGTLGVTFDGSNISGCVSPTDSTPGGTLRLDFSGCPATSLVSKSLSIGYTLQTTAATVAPCTDLNFFSNSRLTSGTTTIYSAVPVQVQAPDMSVSITGLGENIENGGTKSVTVTLTANDALSKDVFFTLSNDNYVLPDLTTTTCSGIAPTGCTPTSDSSGYHWYFADGFTATGQSAVLQMTVQKMPTAYGNLDGTVYFDDSCTDDGAYDSTCSTTASASPALVRSGNLAITVDPAILSTSSKALQWKTYITNHGSGTAYNVWVDHLLESGMTYTSSTVDNMTGVTITSGQDHTGAAINGAVTIIASLAPGESREITLNAARIARTNLTYTATSSWGVQGVDGQTPVSDSSTVDLLPLVVTNANDSGTGSLRQAIADGLSGDTITFAGDFTIHLASQLTISEALTIDGSGHSITISGDDSVRVMEVNNTSGTVTLNELNIVDGAAPGGGYGGGISNTGRLSVQNSTITGSAAAVGGGIYNVGTLTITDSTLSGNAATSAGVGGGVVNHLNGTVTITNSTLTGNTAYDGAGIYNNTNGTLTVTNSTFSGNTASGDYSTGGGITNNGTATIESSTFTSNSAVYQGGGIANMGGSLTIRNSTLTVNTASQGGGFFNYSGATLTVRNNTISGNSASNQGGGIYNYGTLNLANTIMANSPSGGDCQTSSGTVSADHTLVEASGSNACGLVNGVTGNIIGQDPLLGTLGDYGGDTQTHSLMPGSQALDTGLNCLATDQRGVTRPQGPACDIGAVESRGFTLTMTGGDSQSTAITTAFTTPLSLTITSVDGGPVDGGLVTFSGPGSGAGAIPVTATVTITGGAAETSVTANSIAGSYTVSADTPGALAGVDYSLTNTCSSAITVTSANDSGSGSLRQAVAIACPGGVITFDANYTIHLTSELTISKALTIDGSGHSITISGDDSVRVMEVNNTSGTVTLNELNIVDGAAPGGGYGGGISNTGRLSVQNSTITGSAAAVGGGIYNVGTLTITDSTLSGNAATSAGVGGGVVNHLNGTVTITNSTLTGNTAYDGAGIYNNTNGTLTVTNSTFSGNTASGDYSTGGGITNNGTATIESSTFTSNSAVYQGGGIANMGGSLTIRNSTLTVNTASQGGGFFNYSGATLTVRNNTISGNSASNQGGGIYNYGTLNLANTIMANSPSGGDCQTSSGTVSADHTLVEASGANACGLVNGVTGNITGQDPQLGTLGDYGGLTQTYSLLPGSQAIDTGLNCLATDQRGITRPQGSVCDIGSFELEYHTVTFDANGGGTPNPATKSVTFDSAYGTLATIARSGFTFDGWYDAASGGNLVSAATLVTTASNHTLYAHWTEAAPDAFGKSAPADAATGVSLAPTLSWGASAGQTDYEYCYDSASSGPCTGLWISTSNTSSAVLSGLDTSTTYRWQVRAVHAGLYTYADSATLWTFTTASCSTAITVTNANDSGAGSLRQAIANVCPAGTITFNGDYTIHLLSTLSIGKNLTIDGSVHTVTISGDSDSDGDGDVQVFNIPVGAVVTMDHLQVTKGTADNGGGIYNAGTVTLKNSTIYANNASSDGGGLFNRYGRMTLENSTVSGNLTSGNGGGIESINGLLTVTNSTIAGNTAATGGGGIYSWGSDLSLGNTIIADSVGGDCALAGGATMIANINNLIEDGSCSNNGTLFLRSDPRLGPLANNSGPTLTHKLLPGSLAIESGDNAVCDTLEVAPTLDKDQRGVTRPQMPRCDIGAYEADPQAVLRLTKSVTPATNVTYAGGEVTYTIVLENVSTMNDPVVTLTDTLPAGMTFKSWVTNSGASVSSNQITWSGTLGSQTVLTFEFTATHSAGMTNTNTVTAQDAIQTVQASATSTASCPSTLVVSNDNDSGLGSLRQAIADVCPGGTITFDSNYTITNNSELTIQKNLTIDGIGRNITVNGGGANRVFYIGNNTVSINHLTITNGNQAGGGGGMMLYNGTLNLLNMTISGNHSTDPTYGGGGIYNDSGTLTIVGSTLSGNTATNTGGSGDAGSGGAIHNNGGTVTITNSTIVGNSSSNASGGVAVGGIYSNSGSISLQNTTIAGNTASATNGGSAVGGLYKAGSAATITNTILAGNQSGLNCGGTASSAANSLEWGVGAASSSCGAGFISADPLLSSAGDYGGPNDTLALLPGSGAINAGSSCALIDQRGITRPQGAACDIGAFESRGFNLTVSSGNNQSAAINSAFANPLTISVTSTYSEPVDGGQVTFTPPSPSGASASMTGSPASISGGTVSVTATANATIGGPYSVTAGAAGAADATFSLTNTALPNITINDVSTAEGNSGPKTFSFTVSLSYPAPSGGVSFDIATADNTATTANSDYTAQSQTGQTIPAGSSTSTFAVSVNGDSAVEPNETFFVNVTNIAGATALDAQGLGTINNDDFAGFTVNPTSGLTTTESGGTATFTIVLNTLPTADVVISLGSSNTNEGTVSPASLTFKSTDWNSPQTVTITGVDDSSIDGNAPYTIQTGAAASADLNYNDLAVADVSVTNSDNDTAGITVSPTSGLTTTEAGGTATFTVVLNTQPTADVIISLTSSDTSEGTVSPASLTFTPANWNTPQTVTITAVDDALVDGDISYTIQTGPATSADLNYSGFDPTDVSITNQDDDSLGAVLTTDVHNASHSVISSALVGDLVHASVEVDGNGTPALTGAVTFSTYNNVSCSGTAVNTETVVLNASGLADMTSSTALTAEGLSFLVHYNGDTNYPAAEGDCATISTSQYPAVLELSVRTIPYQNQVLSTGINRVVVQFNMDVYHLATGDEHSASNRNNYLLIGPGPNKTFDTSETSGCINGLAGDDKSVPINSAVYDPSTYTATVQINGGTRLPAGRYRLYVCGSTSITDLAEDVELNNGQDTAINFSVISQNNSSKKSISTGFAPDMVTMLPEQPTGLAYTPSELWIEIPTLGIKQQIVGIPQTEAGWDVSWLADSIGYLQGTAFPTWAGNSVLTGHVTGADGLPGVFAHLGTLDWGKQIIIHAYGQKYIYEVRTVDKWSNPDSTRVIEKHEELPWLTLITCRGYDEETGTYRYRTVIRAVQVKVEEE